MAVRDIVLLGHPALRAKAAHVRRVDARVRALMDDMLETMHAAPGVGLAAPQVAESVRVIVACVEDQEVALANPRVVTRSRDEETDVEACLSIPNVQGMVRRPEGVVIAGLDRDGDAVRLEVEGFFARCLQHEIDHLDGIVFLDRVEDPKVRWTRYATDPETGEVVREVEFVTVRDVHRRFLERAARGTLVRVPGEDEGEDEGEEADEPEDVEVEREEAAR